MAASAAFRIASVTLKTASSTALFWTIVPVIIANHRLQPRNSTSVAELANRWLDRGSEMSSWVHGNKFSRRCSADRDSDQKSTVRSAVRENL
ncbi:hypothetical protein TNCV_143601 [Trichonephila clavipes]|nr:hypothetical protein TNCV_143601 [Trichonephila clavipes]